MTPKTPPRNGKGSIEKDVLSRSLHAEGNLRQLAAQALSDAAALNISVFRRTPFFVWTCLSTLEIWMLHDVSFP